ncbi:O-antigen ligase family protein [Pelagerythrobacter rhizovicinus]|nr:O-antigen ligase family protein [Pelagerythrobacter rhizovicinus]
MQSLILLRPVSLLALGYGLLTLSRKHIRQYWPLVTIAGVTVVLTAVHLIPLPPGIWQSLPGRETIAELDALLGLKDQWRPLTLDPQATRNALFALATPCAVLVLGIQLDARQHEKLLTLILGLGVLTAIWGLLQLMGSPRGPLYLYSLTSYGSPVGLFANRNHQAVFLASLIPVMYCWAQLAQGLWKDIGTTRGKRGAMAMGGMLLLIPLILITGSRSGLLMLVFSACVTAALITVAAPSGNRRRTHRSSALARIAPAAVGVVVVAGLGLVTIGLGRDRAFERLIGSDPIADTRADLLPETWRIAADMFPWGAGIGSFDDVYRMHEVDALLRPSYVNHAHNDFLEVLMAGGLLGALLLIFTIMLFAVRGWAIWRAGRAEIRTNIRPATALTALAILFIASLIDYPLRVPALASYAVLLAIWTGKGTQVADLPLREHGPRRTRRGQHSEHGS